MKKIILLTLLVIMSITIKAQDKTLPNITIKDLKGKSVNLKNYISNTKPTVISFWATWCKPCMKELSNLHEVYDEWKEETGVEIIIISIDDSRSQSKVKPYINSMGWEFKGFLDPNREVARSLHVISVPHTFLVDKAGNIVYENKGYIEGDEETLYRHLISTK